MKQKMKLGLNIILFCCIAFLTSCERDDLSDIPSRLDSGVSAKYISLDDFKNTTTAFGQFEAIHSKSLKSKIVNDRSSKLVYNSEYDFYIDTDRILSVEAGDYHSYTFPIYRAGSELIENLVFSLNDNNLYDVYISSYNLNEIDKEKLLRHEPFDLQDKTTFTRLGTAPVETTTGRSGTVGTMAYDDPCQPHLYAIEAILDSNDELIGYKFYYTNPCPNGVPSSGGGGGGGSSGDDDDDPGIGEWPTIPDFPTTGGGTLPGSGGGGGSNPGTGGTGGGTAPVTGPTFGGGTVIITIPVITDPTAKHLKQLNDITNNASKPYKAKVTVLQNSFGLSIETGFEYRTNNFGGLQPAIQKPATINGVQFGPAEKNTLVRMHSHHNMLDPIFSEKDVMGMSKFFIDKNNLGASDRDDITSLLITRTGAYAMKVDNPTKLAAFYQNLKTGMAKNGEKTYKQQFVDDYFEQVVGLANGDCKATCSDAEYDAYLEKYFIKWLIKEDVGISYYAGKIKADGTYTWAKTTLN